MVLAVVLCWPHTALSFDVRLADDTQAFETGGMIALFPRPEDAARLAVAGGEPPEELHLTLVDFDLDVTGRPDNELARRVGEVVARWSTEIKAQAFGHATFSPGTPSECEVYLIGDAPELADLRDELIEVAAQVYPLQAQHDPWIPHVTARYGMSETELAYTGPVVFDRVGLRWGGHETDYPL
ncbi:hypothetical protein BST36_04395 [Mycolicibacterium moriokaense]|uniref:2'-5' RNA ligase family protein n=1 Tax=Mycolicibacterium moriokaense TaxID=39691 RepID=A0AAD1HFB8_9MYCO|nr:hypothetical protein BST36_04395 [Mycolicibacterium moriokaense]BBX02963.1 hypothetical protein MMOR_38990 [Mycolicibacterium moriokaense]